MSHESSEKHSLSTSSGFRSDLGTKLAWQITRPLWSTFDQQSTGECGLELPDSEDVRVLVGGIVAGVQEAKSLHKIVLSGRLNTCKEAKVGLQNERKHSEGSLSVRFTVWAGSMPELRPIDCDSSAQTLHYIR